MNDKHSLKNFEAQIIRKKFRPVMLRYQASLITYHQMLSCLPDEGGICREMLQHEAF